MSEPQQLSNALFPCVPRLALSSPKMSFPDILATYQQASSFLRADSINSRYLRKQYLEGNYEHSQAWLCCIASIGEHWYPLHQSTILQSTRQHWLRLEVTNTYGLRESVQGWDKLLEKDPRSSWFICYHNSHYSSWATVLYIQLQISLRGEGLKMDSFLLSFFSFYLNKCLYGTGWPEQSLCLISVLNFCFVTWFHMVSLKDQYWNSSGFPIGSTSKVIL